MDFDRGIRTHLLHSGQVSGPVATLYFCCVSSRCYHYRSVFTSTVFEPSNKVLRLSLHWLHVLVFAVLWLAIAYLMRRPFNDQVSENVVLLAQLGGSLYFVLLVKGGKNRKRP